MDRDVLSGVRQESPQALAHLAGRPPGEGDREALGGGGAVARDEVRDAMGEGPGLAGTGSGHDEQRSGGDLGRAPLIRVEPGQDVGGSGGGNGGNRIPCV